MRLAVFRSAMIFGAAVLGTGCSGNTPRIECSPAVVVSQPSPDARGFEAQYERMASASSIVKACLRNSAYRLAHGSETVAETVEAVLGACSEEIEIHRNNSSARYFGPEYEATIDQQIAVEAALSKEVRQIATYRVIEARQGGCRA